MGIAKSKILTHDKRQKPIPLAFFCKKPSGAMVSIYFRPNDCAQNISVAIGVNGFSQLFSTIFRLKPIRPTSGKIEPIPDCNILHLNNLDM
jgi:hypothetical protein